MNENKNSECFLSLRYFKLDYTPVLICEDLEKVMDKHKFLDLNLFYDNAEFYQFEINRRGEKSYGYPSVPIEKDGKNSDDFKIFLKKEITNLLEYGLHRQVENWDFPPID